MLRSMQVWKALIVCVLIACARRLAAAGNATGTWVMENGRVTVRLANCSARLCARIIALGDPLDKAGHAKVDGLNPNPSLRTRPLIGLTLSSNIVARGYNTWTGSIYNP